MRAANQFIWENIGKNSEENNVKSNSKEIPYQNSNFKNMLAYWQGLILLRTQILQPLIDALPAKNTNNLESLSKRFVTPSAYTSEFIQFILPENKAMLGYMIGNKILVLINNDNKPNSFDARKMNLKGRWKLIANSNEINLNGISQKTLIGNTIRPNGICIWLNE